MIDTEVTGVFCNDVEAMRANDVETNMTFDVNSLCMELFYEPDLQD